MSLWGPLEVIAKEILDACFSTSYKPNEDDDTYLAQVPALAEKHLRL